MSDSLRTSHPLSRRRVLSALCGVFSGALLLGSLAVTHADNPKGSVVAGRIDMGRADPDEVGVIVYLESRSAQPKAKVPAAGTLQIRQNGKQFEPRLLVVPVGTTVDFPNDDHIFHNVFSLSKAERFDLGLYRSGASKAVTFDREGIVDIYCNIHPEMSAHVLVLSTPYHALVGKDGRFRIEGVPAGAYSLVAWQRYGEAVRQDITVTAGKSTEPKIKMEPGKRPPRHTKKDGEPYGRYR
jgi:plastocyanin